MKTDNYLDTISDELKEYYYILCKEGIPDFLNDYINTKEMLRLKKISVSSGTYYSKMFNISWYSSLDHSIGVALIVWNFTHDKKQTLAALFHDIATPVFKHSIDFMNNDYEKQESTEVLTSTIIKNSKEIMTLLERDNIKLEEVDDYHKYPIADNETPNLSADRLEYTLSNSLGACKKICNLDDIEKIYNNIRVGHNEKGEKELLFYDLKIADDFVFIMSQLSNEYKAPKNKFSMEFLGEAIKILIEKELLTYEELYILNEEEIITIIKSCGYEPLVKAFEIWQRSEDVYESDYYVTGRYCINVNPKNRFIDPLIQILNGTCRVSEVSKRSVENINSTKNFRTKKYIYSNFRL